MPDPLYRYALDKTGVNPDNKVINEAHTLAQLDYRAIAPDYGPFYEESVFVIDDANNTPLIKDVDYFCTELMEEASLKFNKSIMSLIIITNKNVSSNVKITYQTLGGIYTKAVDPIRRLYETVMNDDRTVDWSRVTNKPYGYPPNLHYNHLIDIVGFEPLITAIERIRNAIILTDVPAWEALIDWVKKYVNQRQGIVTEQEIDTITGLDKIVSFERLLYAAKHLNFNTFLFEPDNIRLKHPSTLKVTVRTTNLDDNTRLYWSIRHKDTVPNDFTNLSGSFVVNGNRGQISLGIAEARSVEGDEKFQIEIRLNNFNGPVIAVSSYYTIIHGVPKSNSTAAMFLSCCLLNPRLKNNAKNHFIKRETCLTQKSDARTLTGNP